MERSRTEKVWTSSSPLLKNASSLQKGKLKTPQTCGWYFCIIFVYEEENVTLITHAQERTLDEWAHNSCLLSNKIIALDFKH